MLPTVKLGNTEITRLIVGGNPFSGNSHWSEERDWEMRNFFTYDKIKETLFHCEECGINTMLLRGDMHIMRLILEYRQQGGTMNWIAMTGGEFLSYDGHVNQILQYGPKAIYHHGSVTDQMFKAGQYDELKRRIDVIKSKGLPAGLGTHMPEVIEYAEEHDWGVDFYMACVYNISRTDRVSSAITGRANNGEIFDELDPYLMYRTIRQTPKPCLAFKILGAGRRCQSQEHVYLGFHQAFHNIKPSDAVVVGVYPNGLDHVKLDAEHTQRAIDEAEKDPYRGEQDGQHRKTVLVPGGIPSYWENSVQVAAEKFQKHEAATEVSSSFAFVCDTHWEHNNKNTVPVINAIKAKTSLRRVIFGGDLMQAQPALSDSERVVADWVKHMNGLGRDGWYAVRGNHDNNACWGPFSPAEVWTDDQYYDKILANAKNANADGSKKLYGYADDPVAKVRYYFLDTGSSGMDPADPTKINMVPYADQLVWMKDNAKDLDKTWGIAVVQHIGFSEGAIEPEHCYTPAEQATFALLDGIGAPKFDAEGHFSGPYVGGDYPIGTGRTVEKFIAPLTETLDALQADPSAPEVLGVFTGHTHWDCSWMAPGGYPVLATTCDAGMSSAQCYDGLCPHRTPGTDAEQLFDLVQIDRTHRKIYLTRVGLGVDREFSYNG